MYFLRMTSIFFALGLLVSKLFAAPVPSGQDSWSDTETRTYKIQPFTKIYLEGGYKVILEQGTHEELRIKTDVDNFEYIDVQSEVSTLNLKIRKNHIDLDELVLYITFVKLEKLDIEGGIKLETRGYMDLQDFDLHAQGAALVDMNMKVNVFEVIGEGGVKFEFDGIADTMDARISGAGYLDATDLKTKYAECTIEGVGAASLYVTDKLKGTITGVGKIRYKGDPQVTKRIDGLGLISND